MTAAEKKILDFHINAITAARDWCSDAKDEFESKFEGKSEKWQEGEKGQEMQEQIETLDNLYANLDSAADDLSILLESA